MVDLCNRILTPQGAANLGFPWAVVIPAVLATAGTITTAAIAARTSKKNNEAAKELARMQIDAQKESMKNYGNFPFSTTSTPTPTTTQPQTQDNTFLYAALAGLALIMILKK